MRNRIIFPVVSFMIMLFTFSVFAQNIDMGDAIKGLQYVNTQIFNSAVKIVGILLFLGACWYAWDGYHKEQLTDRLVKIIGMVVFIAFLQLLPTIWFKFTGTDAIEGYSKGTKATTP